MWSSYDGSGIPGVPAAGESFAALVMQGAHNLLKTSELLVSSDRIGEVSLVREAQLDYAFALLRKDMLLRACDKHGDFITALGSQ